MTNEETVTFPIYTVEGTKRRAFVVDKALGSGERAIAIIAWRAPPSHLESDLWTPSPSERLPPYPGLLIPPLPAPERYDLSHHPIVRPRSAHAARC